MKSCGFSVKLNIFSSQTTLAVYSFAYKMATTWLCVLAVHPEMVNKVQWWEATNCNACHCVSLTSCQPGRKPVSIIAVEHTQVKDINNFNRVPQLLSFETGSSVTPWVWCWARVKPLFNWPDLLITLQCVWHHDDTDSLFPWPKWVFNQSTALPLDIPVCLISIVVYALYAIMIYKDIQGGWHWFTCTDAFQMLL